MRAQQNARPVIGWLHSLSADRSAAVIAAFGDGLRNPKTAKALGLAVPPALLARADEVIE